MAGDVGAWRRTASAGDLVENPLVGLLQAGAQRNARRPPQTLHDQRVVAIAPVDTFRGCQIVSARQFDGSDVFSKMQVY